ncbi:MAG: class I tRNA ligase family protein [Candidatus Zambryskibacteria bacterium]|nr:class I tRNA ligase family protein [Candidatus Zambryskibacteria bacterium]
MTSENQNPKSDRALKEEAILNFWKDNKIFEKSLEKEAPEGEFVFYEGPPTANGKPGIHHIEARSFKDAIPRYKTMRGFHVARKAGWDTHGLPVELEVEKQLGLKSKKEIEKYGIAKFNEESKKSVWKYVDEWREFTDRIGYWVDIDNAYVTYHNSYIETVWSILAKVEEKKLLYKDYKVLPWCPRCGTALSSHELAQGYKDVKDLSVYVKFKAKVNLDYNVYLVAWTTTPWTLPGNVALAVGEDINYLWLKKENEVLIVAEDRMEVVGEGYEIIKSTKGEELLGMEYEPLFNELKTHMQASELQKKEFSSVVNGWSVYLADFVTTEDGSGIVHTAVMYGQDDFALGAEKNLPKVHTVSDTGNFISGVVPDFLAGRYVKEMDENGKPTLDVDIIDYLKKNNLLLKQENYKHQYPHCWRCKTPLIYYARDSWYIAMSKLRDELVKENEKINWEPNYIKEGRFGEWLREIKDWAISRERYWGTPLPVWENADKTKRVLVDSLDTLKKYTKTNKNTFVFMRHGETVGNTRKLWRGNPLTHDPLTENGKAQVKNSAADLRGTDFDLVFISPFDRARETADILLPELGLSEDKLKVDPRLSEWNAGAEFELKPLDQFFATLDKQADKYHFKTADGESFVDMVRRVGDFMYELDSKYEGKNILIITHGGVVRGAGLVAEGFDYASITEKLVDLGVKNAEVRSVNFVPLPHNENFELDLHKPYIDEVVLEKDGEEYRRVKEVMDVWFDSGAMPFASFDSAQDRQYPADFISEAIDQTRGWFYTLHAIGVLMGKGRAYKNVVCLGHILDKEGKKMSKSVGNVVNPWEMIDKYGVDVLRLWMYSVNQPGESKNFDERSVDELQKRVFNLLDNVYSFYELYRDKECEVNDLEVEKSDVLDSWIVAKLDKLTSEVTTKLDEYKLLEPVRELREFIDDLSTWYLRRSRERIKAGDKDAKKTLYYVLKTVSKLMAPFAPFTADDLYQKLRREDDALSVHLEKWPEMKKPGLLSLIKGESKNEDLLEKMDETRRLVSLALEARSKSNIKVRQPLQKLEIRNAKLENEYLEIIKDELNVKEVSVNPVLENEVALDTTLTDELLEEGKMRDAVRTIQEWRKEKGLKPGEKSSYPVPDEQKEIFVKFAEEIKKATNVEF